MKLTIPHTLLIASLGVATLAGFAVRAAEVPVGFDVSAIARFVEDEAAAERVAQPSARQQRRLHRLATAAHLFRRIAAADTPTLARGFAPQPPGALDALLATELFARAPAIWRYFFRYTTVHVGRIDAPVSRIGFYNPLVDGWVFADWSWSEVDEPRLIWTEVAPGEVVRGEKLLGAAPVAWVTGRRGPIVATQRAIAAESTAAFADAHPVLAALPPSESPPGRADAAQREAVELRLVAGLLQVNAHISTPEVAALTAEFLGALGAGAEAKLADLADGVGAQARHRVAGLPTVLRQRLELAAWHPTADGGIAVFAVPMIARAVILARYTTGKIAPPALSELAVVDLAPAEGGDDATR